MRSTLACVLLLAAVAPAQALRAQVDGRVELMSIIFRLAGSPEYNRVNSRSRYAGRVERQFGKFRDHKVVRMARELRRTRGVSYDAVMSMAVHLRDAETLAERIPFDAPPARLDARWRAGEARQFLVAARAFAKESDFAGFMEREREFHTAAAARLQKKIDERDHIAWLDRYFGGKGRAQTLVLVGLLNGGGNYGVGVRFPDGREEITPVLGVYQFDEKGLPVPGNNFVWLLAHEISHSYVNPLIDKHADRLRASGEAIFPTVADSMRSQAYTNWKIMLYESLVRASVVRYLLAAEGATAAAKQAASDTRRGFAWTADLARLLGKYEADRATYKTLDSFMPQIAKFFDERVPPAPLVISMTPSNGAQSVDPASRAIVIRFDRPMRPGSWSVVRTEALFPELTGKLSYDARHLVLTIPVRLQPNTSYGFLLNSDKLTAFRSAQGVPLAPLRVSFRTKGR